MKSPIFSHKIKTRYAETDRMGFIHHSVYLIYLEEARTMLWEYLGYPYYKMEDEGYLVVVLSVNLEYKKPSFYSDVLRIDVLDIEQTGIKFSYIYNVYNETRDYLSVLAKTTHVFINREQKIIRVPREIGDIVKSLKR